MGDRANIKLRDQGKDIYVYTHWCGHEWPLMLQEAMKAAKGRWSDPSYAQRVIITECCKSARDATGFGVSTSPGDNEHDIMEVDFDAQRVRKLSQEGFFEKNPKWEDRPPAVLREWSFEEYCGADLAEKEELEPS